MRKITRRGFLHTVSGAATVGIASLTAQDQIQGFEKAITDEESWKAWQPVSDRRIRVGIAGHGVCQFGAAFSFQHHPNVIVAAVSDLDPSRCRDLARACRCQRMYPSCEAMIRDDSLEAIFIATDAPSHARLAIAALAAGKHVASAVPAVFGSLEDAEALFTAVKSSGLIYMMFETSYFHEDLHAMRQLYRAGDLGQVIYAEGEYWHYMPTPIDSYMGWRIGLPPQWYPTHSNAYYVGVTGGGFAEVSCMGVPSIIDHLRPENNLYQNPFGTEIALFRTSDGGMARMGVSWDSPGDSGEKGRIRTQKGTFYGRFDSGEEKGAEPVSRPPLPPGVEAGGHGGSHGYLMSEFVEAILLNRRPLVDIVHSLNMTVSGIVAHQSALRDGELLKIPRYEL
ncbi:Gfo/Idh/MocA family oxidoreductase [candidate division KSB1 bacterium]|nr:Gfo/Idh/MocA family oxidoreductase [candidate division KSB1 bacterium]RQW07980.1 MAG: gfo/Idh/MocA family oxidoreductase [candidate division KSB1 bacterium]